MLRDNRARARNARLVFLLFALVSGLVLVLSILGQLQPDWPTTTSGFSSKLTAGIYYSYALLSLVFLVMLVVAYVALIMWLRRAYYNLHQLPDIHPDYSDGWAAGAWFVPFINFWRPYTITCEVWNDTQRAALGHISEPDTLLGWWWAAFVLKLLIGRLTWYMSSHGSQGLTQGDLLAASLDAGSQLLSAALTWVVIGRIAHFEEQLTLRQKLHLFGQPAPLPTQAGDQADYALEEGY